MRSRALVIEKRKWDGSVSARWSAWFREEGDRIIWWTPVGTRRERPRTGGHEITETHEVSATTGAGWIVTAHVNVTGGLERYEVDATLGGERVAGEEVAERVFAFIDLDLDLEIEGGEVVVKDLLQFAERRADMDYPPALLRTALEALDAARALHAARAWPFDGSLAGEIGR